LSKTEFEGKNHTNTVPGHQVQFSNGLAFFHTCQGTQHVWKNAKKHNPLTKFGCDFVGIHIYFFTFFKKKFQTPPKNRKKLIFVFFLIKVQFFAFTFMPFLDFFLF